MIRFYHKANVSLNTIYSSYNEHVSIFSGAQNPIFLCMRNYFYVYQWEAETSSQKRTWTIASSVSPEARAQACANHMLSGAMLICKPWCNDIYNRPGRQALQCLAWWVSEAVTRNGGISVYVRPIPFGLMLGRGKWSLFLLKFPSLPEHKWYFCLNKPN